MKIFNRIRALILTSCIVFGCIINNSAMSIPSWVTDAAWTFVTDYDDVFNNFHLDNVDFTPVLAAEPATIRTNFLPTMLPLSWANANLKVKVLSDKKFYEWVPQVDLTGSYGRLVAFDFMSTLISSDTFKEPPTMNDYSIGITFTKAVSNETRLYAGFHYSAVNMSMIMSDSIKEDLPEPFDEILGDLLTKEGINIGNKDYILVTGITNVVRKDKRMIAYLGYGFKYKKIFSRFAWNYDHLEVGFNVYPEGLLVIHPFLGWHWNF